MKRNLLLLISLFLIINCKRVNAQSIVRATLCSFGNSIVSNEVTLLQTIGQPSNVNVAEGEKFYIRQGFQQPPTSNALENKTSLISALLYPSPNNGTFNLLVETADSENYIFLVHDIIGALVGSGEGVSQEPNGVSYSLTSGAYIVSFYQNKQPLGQIKFVVY